MAIVTATVPAKIVMKGTAQMTLHARYIKMILKSFSSSSKSKVAIQTTRGAVLG